MIDTRYMPLLEYSQAAIIINKLLFNEKELLEKMERFFDLNPYRISKENLKSFFKEHFKEFIAWYKKYDLNNEIVYAELIYERLDEIEPHELIGSVSNLLSAVAADIYKDSSYNANEIKSSDDEIRFPNALKFLTWYQRYFNKVEFFTIILLGILIKEGKVVSNGKPITGI